MGGPGGQGTVGWSAWVGSRGLDVPADPAGVALMNFDCLEGPTVGVGTWGPVIPIPRGSARVRGLGVAAGGVTTVPPGAWVPESWVAGRLARSALVVRRRLDGLLDRLRRLRGGVGRHRGGWNLRGLVEPEEASVRVRLPDDDPTLSVNGPLVRLLPAVVVDRLRKRRRRLELALATVGVDVPGVRLVGVPRRL